MIALNPAPADMTFASPALNDWFSMDIHLPVPDADLSVALNLLAGIDWLPPTRCLLSFYIATATRPPDLIGLRRADGTPAFDDDSFVAVLRLLPEVEERLHSLMDTVPPADGSAAADGVASRVRVRYLALELPGPIDIITIANLLPLDYFPAEVNQNDKMATYVGLKLDNVTLTNGEKPMRDIYSPGEPIFHFANQTNATLWAFDANGRSIDPGAVAAWWFYLADHEFNNLWAAGATRTATVDDQLTVHTVNVHEGPLGTTLPDRLNKSNLAGSVDTFTYDGDGSSPAVINFTAAPTPDDAPVPRIALLPNGTYANQVSLWPTGAVDTRLQRDYVRVGVVDVENLLVGQPRSATPPGSPADRRANDQNRESTRVNVARTARPALLTAEGDALNIDTATTATMTVLSGGGTKQLVSSVLDRDWAAINPLTLPDVEPPDVLPTVTITAVTGGGADNGGIITDQIVLLEMTLDPGLAGAWVRAYPQRLDTTTGRRVRMNGGGGLVRADGQVSLLMQLPDGSLSSQALMGVEIVVVTAQRVARHTDHRFDRPAPVGGDKLDLANATGEIVVCESGQLFAGGTIPNDTLPSGASLFAREATPTLLDPTTIPDSAFVTTSAVRNLDAQTTVQLTQPAFIDEPAGAAVADFSGTGATVQRHGRDGIFRVSGATEPIPTMERYEQVAVRVDGSVVSAAVSTAPALAINHELFPHQNGHPGAPAAIETHGTGVVLNGPAAINAAEYARDKVNAATADLATAASTPLPTPADPSSPSLWAATLATVAAGVESEVDIGDIANNPPPPNPYIFGDTLPNVINWFSTHHNITIPSATGNAATSILRALDRRMLAAAYGLRETATSLVNVLSQAEDLVYIETPAFDDLAFGVNNDELHLWDVLHQRVTDQPALRVVICVPIKLMPGMPPPLQRVRNKLVLEAIDNLTSVSGAKERIAIFSPGTGFGRTLRSTATTVVVDDVYALTGNTHLWRRGLTFDSSLAVALFDEQAKNGRSAEITDFRRSLIAGRLGLETSLLPDNPHELVQLIRALHEQGSSMRLATSSISTPTPVPSVDDIDAWNHDGSPNLAFNPVDWLLGLIGTIDSFLSDDTPPP